MNSIDIWNDLGNLYLKANAINAAIDAYNRALQQGYRTADIYRNLASAYVIQGNFRDSIPLFQKSIELLSEAGEKAVVFTRIGESYRRLSEFENAIAAFKSAIEIEPGNPALCVGLEDVQRDLEKLYGFDKTDVPAVSLVIAPIDEDNTEQAVFEQVGSGEGQFIRMDQQEETISQEPAPTIAEQPRNAEFEPAESGNENDHEELSDLSYPVASLWTSVADATVPAFVSDEKTELLPDQGDGQAALEGFLSSASISGQSSHADHDNDGVQLLSEAELQEKENGVRVTLLLTLGIMHWRNGNLEEADSTLRAAIGAAIEINNQWFEALAWHALALVKTALGDIIVAIEAYLRAVELAPDQIFPWNNLGSLYDRLGHDDRALEAFQIAIRQNPEDSTSWDGLGDIYTKLGRLDDAIAAYQLGNVFDKKAKGEDAIRAYEKAFDFYHFTIASFEGEVHKTQQNSSQVEVSDLQNEETPEPAEAEVDCDAFDLSNTNNEPGEFENTGSAENMDSEISAEFPIAAGLEDTGESPALNEEEAHIATEPVVIGEAVDVPCVPVCEAEEQEALDVENIVAEDIAAEETGTATEQDYEGSAVEAFVFAAMQKTEGFSAVSQESTLLGDQLDAESRQPETVWQNLGEQAGEKELLNDDAMDAFLAAGSTNIYQSAVVQTVVETVLKNAIEPAPLNEEILPAVVTYTPAPKPDPTQVAGTIESYEAVVRENPRNDRAWDSLGNLYRITQRNADAIYAFERAVSLEPTRYMYHYQLGTLYAAQGNYRDAIIEIEKVVEINSGFIFAHCALASYLRKIGKNEEAQAHVAIALPHMAKEKEYDRACFESIRGNTERAIELLEAALEKKQTTLEFIRRDLDLDFIRDDPRYKLFEAKYAQSTVEF